MIDEAPIGIPHLSEFIGLNSCREHHYLSGEVTLGQHKVLIDVATRIFPRENIVLGMSLKHWLTVAVRNAHDCSCQSRRQFTLDGQAHMKGHPEDVVDVIKVNIASNHATHAPLPADMFYDLGKQVAPFCAGNLPRPTLQSGLTADKDLTPDASDLI